MYSKCYKRVLFISRTTPLVCFLKRDTAGKTFLSHFFIVLWANFAQFSIELHETWKANFNLVAPTVIIWYCPVFYLLF